MFNSDFENLSHLGIKVSQYQQWLQLEQEVGPARVAAVYRGTCDVLGVPEDVGAELDVASLDCQRVHVPKELSLSVGDWVGVEPAGDCPRVAQVLERHTRLRRGGLEDSSQSKLIAANLDTVFVMVAKAEREKLQRRALNSRRIERLLWLVREGGAAPVVLMNKADLGSDTAPSELTRLLGGVDVLLVSALTGENLEALNPYLGRGQTVALLGPSGVGKSTLINRLLQREVQATGDVRDADAKGRHTTTRGELLPTPGGAWLVDTPGLKAVGVISEDGQTHGFDDIESLSTACRFTNCQHHEEPGCAVAAAMESGQLPAERLRSYRALVSDAARHATRNDAYARHLQHKAIRKRARVVRDAVGLKQGKR